MADLPASFAAYPKSIGELRSDKDDSAAKWAPRDLLIHVLRQIDEGKIAPDAMVIAWRKGVTDSGEADASYLNASPDIFTSIGLFEYGKMRIMENRGT